MRVQRLRPLPGPAEMAAMYPEPHDHRIYGRGHSERVDATIALAREVLQDAGRRTVADLSCGNGHIARQLCTEQPQGLHLGDYAGAVGAPGEHLYLGAVEHTLPMLPTVDVFVCSETIEHLDDPGLVLRLARAKAGTLVLSTPLDCWDDANGEHLWAWDREFVEHLMDLHGWVPAAFASVDSREYGEPYLYGIWVAS